MTEKRDIVEKLITDSKNNRLDWNRLDYMDIVAVHGTSVNNPRGYECNVANHKFMLVRTGQQMHVVDTLYYLTERYKILVEITESEAKTTDILGNEVDLLGQLYAIVKKLEENIDGIFEDYINF